MRTITAQQLNEVLRQAFDHLDELQHPRNPEEATWPFYAPVDRGRELARCDEGKSFAQQQIKKREEEAYRWLTIYIVYYWTEWFVICERIGGERQELDARFISELGVEVKHFGFQLSL